MKSVSPHAWKILTAIGLLFVGWGFQQIFVIPTIPIDHWAWLTADPEAVDYFKLWLSSHGIWTATNGVFALLVAMTAFRKQEHWAWQALTYLPVHILLLTTLFYWLFFITIPLLALAVWSIRASRDNIRLASETRGSFGWVFFIVIGLAFLYFSYHNLFVIPALNLRDPDQDWTWLTGNPEIIDYITLHFRGFAIKVLTFGMLTLLTAATGLRAGSRRARSILFIDPILIGVHYFVWSWTAPILISAILLSGAVL